MNKEALTLKVNRDGEKLRLSERLLLAFCRPVNAPPLPTVTLEYTLHNALDYAKRLIPDFPERVTKLEKNKTYLVHCGAGVRSARACDKMSQLAFPKLYNLEGGFKAWETAGNKPEK